METEIQVLNKISLGAFPRESVQQAVSALKTVQQRYPAIASMQPSRSGSAAADEGNSAFPRTEAKIVEYVSRYADTVPPTDDLSKAAWSLAQQHAPPRDAVASYLDLLRRLDSPVEILPIRPLHDGITLSSDGTKRPVIIPFMEGDIWAFAVAYADCVHWYDSRREKHVPVLSSPDDRSVTNVWTGPQHQRSEDAALFMLMGIRCIQRGCPHLAQETAVDLVSNFRAQVVMELLCGKVNPTRYETSRLLSQEIEEQSLFFDDAMNGLDERPSPPPYTEPDHVFRPTPNAFSYDIPSIPVSVQPAGKRISRENVLKVTDAQTILTNLNEACLATRAVVQSTGTPLDILWCLVQNISSTSAFHDRRNAVLFYEEMKRHKTDQDVKGAMKYPTSIQDMRAVQAHCKFWKDICELRSSWGEDKYVLLLAFPRNFTGRSGRARHIRELEQRLNDGADHLEAYLHAARDMCRAIMDNSLPGESLMIDVYHLKKHEPLTESSYDAFVSVKPRAKLPIPRWVT
ncbi:hypothetical protein NLG97_g5059 [Lecanicillium saksenae]|uniref:Uncharacterized protein n=1 Tax=Lecanicillium saksenae TaxID=468837 RepID=A0ACC1QV76_9HYPO|nr:hypothetical protein NLG97_g5059 [Lecanicillium saksenae]